MIWLFNALTDRLKALFVANVGLDMEAQFVAQQAERKAELLRRAHRYQEEGLVGIANQLRQQAEAIDIKQPAASILPSIEHWQDHDARSQATPLLSAPVNNSPPNGNHKRLLSSTRTTKKRNR